MMDSHLKNESSVQQLDIFFLTMYVVLLHCEQNQNQNHYKSSS